MEKAMVSANCRKRMPVVPGKNATGTNTATNTSEVAMTAPATSLIADRRGLMGVGLSFLNVAFDILDHHDCVVDHQSGCQSDAK